MVVSKRRKLFAWVVCLILVICLIIAVRFIYISKYHNNEPLIKNNTLNPNFEEVVKEGEIRQLTDEKIVEIYNLLNDKKYTEVVALAKVRCSELVGNIQLICYNYHGKALKELDNLSALIVLAEEVLKTDAIQQNETATNIWKFDLENAKKGINPKNLTMGGDEAEARR